MTWKPEKFLTGLSSGATEVDGYTHKGLGLYLSAPPSLKGRRPSEWCLVHLGSGHAVGWITGAVEIAFPIATAFAEATDWTAFDRPDGWKQTDPSLPQKMMELATKHPKAARIGRGRGQDHARSEEIAREIAYARA